MRKLSECIFGVLMHARKKAQGSINGMNKCNRSAERVANDTYLLLNIPTPQYEIRHFEAFGYRWRLFRALEEGQCVENWIRPVSKRT